MQRGACDEAMTSRAGATISADRTRLAPATTAADSEIVEDLLLAGALLGELRADCSKRRDHFKAHPHGNLGRVPGK